MDKKVLLIADDDQMNRMIINRFLKDTYTVIEAEDGEAALNILHTTYVDAVLLDIIMPKVDGLKVLEQMKSEKELNHIGVLIATSTKEKTERSALAMGADDVVSKPYDPVVIKKRLENIITVKKMQAQRELLKNADIESYAEDKQREIVMRITPIAEKIIRTADVINANKSNFKLVDELLNEIKNEADNILNCTNN